MGNLRIDPVRQADGPHAWALDVAGDLDASTIDVFDEAVDEVIGNGAQTVVLELTHVEFLDSTGLRGLVRASNLLDGRLTVAGLSGAAERVLELTGLLERLRDTTADD